MKYISNVVIPACWSRVDPLKFSESLIIFSATMFLVIKKPFGIGIGYSSLIGAALTLILGLTTLNQVVTVWDIVWNATFTFVAIIVLSMIYDEIGFFDQIAKKITEHSNGSIRLLFVFMILLGSVVSALFANDGAVLVLTPIVLSLVRNLGLDKKAQIAFVISIGFISDTASVPLTISNLVNIITAGYFKIDFIQYFSVMYLPYIVSVLASLAVLWLFFHSSLPRAVPPKVPPASGLPVRDPAMIKAGIPVLVSLIALYAITGVYGIPISFIAVPVVGILLVIVSLRKSVSARRVLKEAPWQIVLFSIGMYIIVFGLGYNGFIGLLSGLILRISSLPGPLPLLLSGYLFSGMASVMNNLPSVMLGNLAIPLSLSNTHLAYANIIGNDIGTKFTPIGSLATLLWLNSLDKNSGIKISYGYYMKVGLIICIPVLTITLISLYFV